MGKGYANFMCKKPFHPGSRDNIKRVWMAQQRDADNKKREDEMRSQYEKEQDLYTNRLLVAGQDSKDKLSLNFMYEAPAGLKKEKELDTSEPEYKFEWQRNAPRESFAKNNADITDQPFGIQVRNVRCLKCQKWGHVNTDRECTMYNSDSVFVKNIDEDKSGEIGSGNINEINGQTKRKTDEGLQKSMKEDQGLAIKKYIFNNDRDSKETRTIIKDPETVFIESLSTKDKKTMLKNLQKLMAKSGMKDSIISKNKHKKKSKKSKKEKKNKKNRKEQQDSSCSDSDDSEDEERGRKRRNHYENDNKKTKRSDSKDERRHHDVRERKKRREEEDQKAKRRHERSLSRGRGRKRE